MRNANKEKREMTHEFSNRTTKPRKVQNARKKGNLQILGNKESGHIQTSGDERKKSQENEETNRNQTIHKKFHQKIKHLGIPLRKILATILEVDDGRTLRNGPENKKLMTMHKSLHPRDEIH